MEKISGIFAICFYRMLLMNAIVSEKAVFANNAGERGYTKITAIGKASAVISGIP